ncbi:N-6 DNA methylase [Sporomusa carbonis]|uniref:N-6 DNA methylase n=1 Tax=Sporomusa carbonis TaxID=3076075 RepID=UPI003C7B99B4
MRGRSSYSAANIFAGTYHNWRNIDGDYRDIPGFCKSATIEEVAALDYVLTPGRYVGLPEEEDDFDLKKGSSS